MCKRLQLTLNHHWRLDIFVNNAGTTDDKKRSLRGHKGRARPYPGKTIFLNTSSVAGKEVGVGQVWCGGSKVLLDSYPGPSGVRAEGVRSVPAMRNRPLERVSEHPDTPEERKKFSQMASPLR
ncbi:hypothetical protein BDZ91DRAFT_853938 [Kalaharituber pfeilii]|nr:hypothetical protein BDZ91DRAFT_853938 [Kalaharituber pfeilii]